MKCGNPEQGRFSKYTIPPWLTPPLVYEDEITHSCDQGFVVRNTDGLIKQTVTCESDGTWQPEFMDCWGKGFLLKDC